ncbi:RNA 2'-phosphotransferase [candidate division KSB1 bacterium]|nr:RNA 2'-phosphotransferase [candidate division KSB1 bacterium]
MRRELVPISKFLSKILRHHPEQIGLTLDSQGWADVEELIACANRHNVNLDRALLDEIVATNEKKRYSYSDDRSRIRATQGHSISVDLALKNVEPPSILYHGTAIRFWPSIQQDGLQRRGRLHVHLSTDADTAYAVGKRHGKPLILQIDSARMYADGIAFHLSDNSVWLTDCVPAKYIKVCSNPD